MYIYQHTATPCNTLQQTFILNNKAVVQKKTGVKTTLAGDLQKTRSYTSCIFHYFQNFCMCKYYTRVLKTTKTQMTQSLKQTQMTQSLKQTQMTQLLKQTQMTQSLKQIRME